MKLARCTNMLNCGIVGVLRFKDLWHFLRLLAFSNFYIQRMELIHSGARMHTQLKNKVHLKCISWYIFLNIEPLDLISIQKDKWLLLHSIIRNISAFGFPKCGYHLMVLCIQLPVKDPRKKEFQNKSFSVISYIYSPFFHTVIRFNVVEVISLLKRKR